MSVLLVSPIKEWVEDLVHTRAYSNSSGFVGGLIRRRDLDYQQPIADLHQAVDEDLAGGPPEPFDIEGRPSIQTGLRSALLRMKKLRGQTYPTISPLPPASAGMSLNFGSPSSKSTTRTP